MKCAHPIDAAILADYWLALLPSSDENSIEQHIFDCGECTARLDQVIALAHGVRTIARQANLLMTLSDGFVNRSAARGLRIRQYAPPAGGSVQCTISAEDDMLIGRLAANLAGQKQVDLALCNQDGIEYARIADVPFQPRPSEILFQQPIQFAKGAPSQTMIARLLGRDESGAENLVGEYTFIHTRTIPGPPAFE
jgi:hypothetical protein